tara:strand:- start:109 stop:963 length:855 start_codon:yes stop_codon:yes gene_type:complete
MSISNQKYDLPPTSVVLSTSKPTKRKRGKKHVKKKKRHKKIIPNQIRVETFIDMTQEEQSKSIGFTTMDIVNNLHSYHFQEKGFDLNEIALRIADALHQKRRFVEFVECDRETALLHEYNGYSSCCGCNNYFYLNRVTECSLSNEKFSKSEMEMIQDNLFCCYTYGQPCNHENEMCECQMAAATGDHEIILGIDETTIEDEQNIGLIPPMFQIYTKTLVNLQTQEYVVLDGEIPEDIYCISDLAQEIENYPSSASEKLLINNFWSGGMRNDLDLKNVKIVKMSK